MKTAMDTVNEIQNENPNKDKTRNMLSKQVRFFMKKQGHGEICSLPATEWRLERELLAFCKQFHIPCKITGLEIDSKIFPVSEDNMPENKNVEIGNIDYDKFISTHREFNVFWADYCAGVAKFDGFYRYSFPHIEAFAKIVKSLYKSSLKGNRTETLYYMTFYMNGRFIGGLHDLLQSNRAKRHYPHAKTMQEVTLAEIQLHLKEQGIPLDFVKEIFRINYHGKEKSIMITVGFAINCRKGTTPKYFAADWMNAPKTNKTEKVNAEIAVDQKSLNRKAIQTLADAKWSTSSIASLLNLTNNQVGSVLAWHRHPDAFKKIA
jgi:hypothetical protein